MRSQEDIKKSIKEFKDRIPSEREFCFQLFRETTIKLLAAKCAYYKYNNPYLKDEAYDYMEKSWYIMGIALGELKEDEISPCVDYNENHALASEAEKLCLKLIDKK